MKGNHKEKLAEIITELNDIATKYPRTHVDESLYEAIENIEEALCIIKEDEEEEEEEGNP